MPEPRREIIRVIAEKLVDAVHGTVDEHGWITLQEIVDAMNVAVVALKEAAREDDRKREKVKN